MLHVDCVAVDAVGGERRCSPPPRRPCSSPSSLTVVVDEGLQRGAVGQLGVAHVDVQRPATAGSEPSAIVSVVGADAAAAAVDLDLLDLVGAPAAA